MQKTKMYLIDVPDSDSEMLQLCERDVPDSDSEMLQLCEESKMYL